MAHPGIKSRFKLENAAGSLQDISIYLDGVNGASSTDFIDGTTFQPDAVGTALKNEIPSFATKSKSLSGKWTEESETFFSGIEGLQNLSYEERPAHGDGVDITITGLASCGSYSGPIYGTDGVGTFTAELRIQTRTLGGSPA